MAHYAVVLLNLGGPDSLEAIEPFLRNLFSDRDIFKIPVGQRLFAKLIAKARAPKVTERYKKIGGKSPINEWTAVQRKNLENALNKDARDFEVHVGMRYWQPAIKGVAAGLSETDVEKIILLPLYPHYSITTTGSSFREWQRSYAGPSDRLVYVDHFCDNETYIAAINQRIDETILRFPESARNDIQIVFSAHGTPQRLVDQGDPYSSQIMKTIESVMLKRSFDYPHHLCFQSKVGPLQWLKPSTRETLTALAAEHKKQILVVPISFVSDHIETLFELAIEYRDVAVNAGIENYVVMKGLNDSGLFISALKEVTLQALNSDKAKPGTNG